MRLSSRALSISASMTLEIDAKAKRMKADGLDVVGFGAGEPDFPTPAHIVAAAHEALDLGMTRYTPSSGTDALRKAICDKLLAENGLTYAPGQIVVSNGAKHSLYNAFQAILNPGDQVLIPSPHWLSYPEMVRMSDGEPVLVETYESQGFKPDEAKLRAALTERARAIVVNSPSNPTGCVYDRDTLLMIADFARENDLYIVADEIYEKLIYDGCEHVSIAALSEDAYERTITVNGFSKAFAMTGWRLGYIAAAKEVASVAGNLQSHATSNPNSIAQHAAVAALRGPQQPIADMVRAFDQRRQYLCGQINDTPGISCVVPHGAFYVMMNISQLKGKSCAAGRIEDSMTFSSLLLEAQQVALVPGIAFGADDFVRLSYAVDQKMIAEGMRRIRAFIASLD